MAAPPNLVLSHITSSCAGTHVDHQPPSLGSAPIAHKYLLLGHPLGETDLEKSRIQGLEAAHGHLGSLGVLVPPSMI